MTIHGSHFIPSCSWKVDELTEQDRANISRYNNLLDEHIKISTQLDNLSMIDRISQTIQNIFPEYDPKALIAKASALRQRIMHYTHQDQSNTAQMSQSDIPRALSLKSDDSSAQTSNQDQLVQRREAIEKEMDSLFTTKVYCKKDRLTTTPRYIIDPTTGDIYFNETKTTIRLKGVLLLFGMIYQVVNAIGLLGQRLAALTNGDRSLKQLGAILLLPFILIGLCIASIGTIIDPYNGRKLYATLERLLYKDLIDDPKEIDFLAPCFQPRNIGSRVEHLFGGDGQNAF